MTELKKILYAEDEPDIRTIVEISISSTSDCEILFVENGKELLEKVEDINPDLIMLDVMMPEMDGPTALLELRKNPKTKDIPVIFMTAKAQIHELKSLEKMGILGILTKPFDPIELFPSIQKIWNESHE